MKSFVNLHISHRFPVALILFLVITVSGCYFLDDHKFGKSINNNTLLFYVLRSTGTVSRSGLVGEWLFSGNADDTSGNLHNGTVSGAVLTSDRKGNASSAYSFATNGSYIHFSDASLPSGSNARTISLWVKMTGTRDNGEIFYYGTESAGRQVDISYTTAPSFNFDRYGGGITMSASSLSSCAWRHVVYTYSNEGTLTVYVDGVQLMAPSSYTLSTALSYGRIGCAGSGITFNGAIDDVRVYNRVLSSSEIQALYTE